MGVHPSALFALKPEALSETRQEVWLWAEPIIADCAVDCYDRALPSRLSSNLLAKKHIRLWHAVMHDEAAALQSARLDLNRICDKFGLAPGLMHDVNEVILEELFDIMLFRSRGSIRATKASTMVLMAARSSLAAA